jgi:RNA polymerase sigma factor (sigma-70 family)
MATLADDVRDRAFERLYEGHVRDVYRYVLAVLRNPADAEDVTQTTFMNAYRAFKAGERPRKPQNWLITIAHNACRTRAVRASRRPREVPLDDVVAQLAVRDEEKPNVRELLRALGRLPFNQRAAITMRELEGRTYPEIAETLGVTVPAVEALLVRARRTMRLQGSALRGLVAVQLPRSLRGAFDTGDVATAGGALLGGGVLAKAAAVVVAGVVAGGIGKTVDAGVLHRSHGAQRLEPRAHTEPSTASHGAPVRLQRALPPSRTAVGTHHRTTHVTVRGPGPVVVSVTAPGGAATPSVGDEQRVVPPSTPPTAALPPTQAPGTVEPPSGPGPTAPIPQPPILSPEPLPVLPQAPGPALPPVELPVAPPAVSPPAVNPPAVAPPAVAPPAVPPLPAPALP